MRIWMINHYGLPLQYSPWARFPTFAKYLVQFGQEVTIFAASSIHNSQTNLIEDENRFREEIVDGVRYIYVYARSYQGKAKRVLNWIDFYRNVQYAAKKLGIHGMSPDVIYASSPHLLTLVAGIRLAAFFHVECVCEVRDLWPEGISAYNILGMGNHHPVIIALRRLEKWIYRKADKIVFTMEGGYDYIREQGWEKVIPQSKVHHINNGVDLEVFDYNKSHYKIDDTDLEDERIFKVVYTGSIRMVNNLGKLLNAAKLVKNPKVKFLVWGRGDELAALEKRVKDENIKNVVFKGYVDKKYIPYITATATATSMHNTLAPIFRFGASLNKMFDYMAAGRPIFVDFQCKYNPVLQCGAGIEIKDPTAENIASAIEHFAGVDREVYEKYCQNARKGAEKYDFKSLTQKLLQIMTGE